MSTSLDSQANSGAATLSPRAGTVAIGHVAQVNARNEADAADPQNAAAVQAVQAAIAAAAPQVNGVNFGPFSAVVVSTSFFSPIWSTDGGDTPVGFYAFQGFPSPSPWLPLGDLVATGGAALPSGVLFFSPGTDSAAFANPVGFNFILSDAGSGNPNDLVYWAPVAPDGYTAVGVCFSNSGDAPPNAANYWCVKTTYLQFVGASTAWTDAGQGWDADGTLLEPSFSADPEIAPEGQILILPPTLLSTQGGQPAFALAGLQATLDVTPIPTPDPVYVSGTTQGDTTDYGLANVVVVPFTAVPGDTIPNQPLQSPFYYVASEPFWLCTATLPTTGGGTQDLQKTTGVSEADAQSFEQTTSLSVSCEFGAAYGGFSAKVSASYSDTLQLGTSHSSTHSTEDTVAVHLVFPIQPITSVWESQNLIQMFRADGTPLTSLAYANGDLRFEPSGATPATLALRAALARG